MWRNAYTVPGNASFTEKISARIRYYGKYKFLFALMVPGLVAMVIFQYIPMYGVIIAFKNYKIKQGILGSAWVGLENFRYLFIREGLWRSLRNSVTLSVAGFFINYLTTIAFALMLSEISNTKFKRTIQTVSYLPHFLSWVVVCSLVIEVLSPSSGIVNALINAMGGEPVFFMSKPQYFKPIVLISDLWKSVGWGSVVYMAALTNADPQLYEAAVIDGANRYQLARHVSLPTLYPILSIYMIMSISTLVSGGNFEQIYNLMNALNFEAADVISTYVYRLGMEDFMYSRSTAMGLLQNTIAILLLIVANSIARRVSDYTLW